MNPLADVPYPASSTNTLTPTYLGYYRDCKDAFEQGQTGSGLYTIKPENTSDRLSVLAHPPFEVYCDMETDGGGGVVCGVHNWIPVRTHCPS